MKTQTEIEQLLNLRLPDGPIKGGGEEYERGAQDMALWILGIGSIPDIGEQ